MFSVKHIELPFAEMCYINKTALTPTSKSVQRLASEWNINISCIIVIHYRLMYLSLKVTSEEQEMEKRTVQ